MVGIRWVFVAVAREPSPTASQTPPVAGPFRDIGPRWSHDGTKIAFLRQWTPGHLQLCVASADLAQLTVLTQPELVNPDIPVVTRRIGFCAPETPEWSPDDAQLTFPRAQQQSAFDEAILPGTDVWSYDLRTGRRRPLALHRIGDGESLQTYRSASWSADGSTVAFVGHGRIDRTRVALAVRTSRRLGDVRELGAATDRSDWPVWAPTGRRLAYAQGVLRGPYAARVAILRVIEPGGRAAFRAVTVTQERYARMCPDDWARHTRRAVQPYITGVRWEAHGRRLFFALTPDALDPERSSIWSVEAMPGATAVRVSPPGDYGYLAPVPLTDGSIGAARIRGSQVEAVLLVPVPTGPCRVRTTVPLPCDDWDWRPDGDAIAVAGPAMTDARRVGLRLLPITRR
jgi:hypothetical protein